MSNEMKAKYATIVDEAKQKGWRVRIWADEVGCRRFPARSMAGLLREVVEESAAQYGDGALSKNGVKTRLVSRAGWYLLLKLKYHPHRRNFDSLRLGG